MIGSVENKIQNLYESLLHRSPFQFDFTMNRKMIGWVPAILVSAVDASLNHLEIGSDENPVDARTITLSGETIESTFTTSNHWVARAIGIMKGARILHIEIT